MGEAKTIPLSQKVKLLLFKDAKFLSSKKEVNWKFVKLVSIVGVCVAVVVLLLLPEPKPEVREFHNSGDPVAQAPEEKKEEPNPNQDTWEQMKALNHFQHETTPCWSCDSLSFQNRRRYHSKIHLQDRSCTDRHSLKPK